MHLQVIWRSMKLCWNHWNTWFLGLDEEIFCFGFTIPKTYIQTCIYTRGLGTSSSVLEVKKSKILQIMNKRDFFKLHSFSIFLVLSTQKLIHTINIICLCVWLIFWTKSTIYFRGLCEKAPRFLHISKHKLLWCAKANCDVK